MQPQRNRIEPGIYERLDANGERLGLEIAYKDAAGKTRRRSVNGGLREARDQLAKARVRRTGRAREANNPRLTFAQVAAEFRAIHLPALRPNSRAFHEASLKRLEKAFGPKRVTTITKADLRAFIGRERQEGLKGWTIDGHLKTLRVVYTFAAEDLDVPVTMPRLKPSERPKPADDEREHRILTDDELAPCTRRA